MLTLYLSPGFSSMAPHIALHEIGVDFESRWISFAKREQYAPEYLALNPEGKVPILLVDGRPLTEVAAILYYLAKRFPKADLFSADDLEAEAHVISWMSFIASTVHPARRIGGVRVERESGVRYVFEGSLKRWKEVFKIAEERLGRRDGPSAVIRSRTSSLSRLLDSTRLAPKTFPCLSAHYERMMARPAVRRVLEIESAVGYQLPQ